MSIFLRRWPDALRPSENSIQSHMVSYCSGIKMNILFTGGNNWYYDSALFVKLSS